MKFIEHEDGIYVDVSEGSVGVIINSFRIFFCPTNGHEYICRDKQVSDGCRVRRKSSGRARDEIKSTSKPSENAERADVE